MRKFSLLMGALGGAMAGYLLSNDKLRHELSKAKKPEDAAKVLGRHLQKDGKKVVTDVQAFVRSDDVQQNLKKAKTYALKQFRTAKKGVESMVRQGGRSMAGAAKGGAKNGRRGNGGFRASDV